MVSVELFTNDVDGEDDDDEVEDDGTDEGAITVDSDVNETFGMLPPFDWPVALLAEFLLLSELIVVMIELVLLRLLLEPEELLFNNMLEPMIFEL